MESIAFGRSYTDTSFDISGCLFERNQVFNNNGGVILITNGDSMKIYNSVFYICTVSSSYTGGAIYFGSNQSSIRMVCANRCSAGWCHFARIQTSKSSIVQYLSYSQCSTTTTGERPLEFSNGDQVFNHNNGSMNRVTYHSAMGIYNPTTMDVSFCSFSNNIAAQWVCLRFFGSTGNITRLNVVHNNSPNHEGVVFVTGFFVFDDCVFFNNRNTLFFVEGNTITVKNCHIYHIDKVYSGSANMISNVMSLTASHILEHYQTHQCNANNPINLYPTAFKRLDPFFIIAIFSFILE